MHVLFRVSAFLILLSSFLFPLSALAQMPDDAWYDKLWYLAQIDAPEAWDTETGSRDVIVAVLDTGVDLDHPDLADAMWENAGEIADNNVDDDDNGFVDDVHGWDFIQDDNNPSPNTNGSETAVSHGTLISGIIGAEGDNKIGVVGVAWDVTIMPVRMLNASGSGDSAVAADAVDYAVANGADVINLSFAGDNVDTQLRRSIRAAYEAGVVVVAAMGNSAQDTDDAAVYPACLRDGDRDWVIGVASTDDSDTPSTFSNYGSTCTDVSAPGENIFGTQYENRREGFAEAYGGYWSGTSMASPIVAGAAALLRAAHPSLSVDEIRNALKLSVDPLSLRASQRRKYGAGRLNVAQALAVAAQYDDANGDNADDAEEDSSSSSDTKANTALATVATGATSGEQPLVDVRSGDGESIAQFAAYATTFTGGLQVALGDLDGDGDDEVVTGVGDGGGPHVRVFTQTGALLAEFFPYATTSREGVKVATGDIDGDGADEIITAVGSGVSQEIVAWSMRGEEKVRFSASTFAAGTDLRVAAGDVNGDGAAEFIVASGEGVAPTVALYSSAGTYLLEFAPYATTFTGGVYVAAGDVNGDGIDEVITGTGDGGGPHVRMFTRIGAVVGSFFAYDDTTRHGVRVASADIDRDGTDEIVAAPGPGMTELRILDAKGNVEASWQVSVTGGEGTAVAAW